MPTFEITPVSRSAVSTNARNLRADHRYRAIAEAAIDAIVSAGADGRIYGWNPASTKMFGWTQKEAMGMPLTLLMPRELRSQHTEGLARFIQTGTGNIVGRTVELRGLRKDGAEFPCEISISTWMDGSRRFFTGVIRDVTERKRAEERLKNLNHDFRALLDAIPRPILVYREGVIVFANRFGALWYGIGSPEALVGRPLNLLLASQADRDLLAERMPRVQQGEIVPERRWVVRLLNGMRRIVEASGSTVEFEGAPAVVSIFTDVTDQFAQAEEPEVTA